MAAKYIIHVRKNGDVAVKTDAGAFACRTALGIQGVHGDTHDVRGDDWVAVMADVLASQDFEARYDDLVAAVTATLRG